jgi:hypothetical protein
MEKDVLYEKGRLKITYLHSPKPAEESKVISIEDHELWIKGIDEKWNRYIIQRGILRELARTAKKRPICLMAKLDLINPNILNDMARERITYNDIGELFINACQKEEDFNNSVYDS